MMDKLPILNGETLSSKSNLIVGAFFSAFFSVLLLIYAVSKFIESFSFEPRTQFLIVDHSFRLMSAQDLSKPVSYTYHSKADGIDAVEDFLKKALLTSFSFTPEDLVNRKTQQDFFDYFSEDVAVKLYEENLLKQMSLTRIVIEQQSVAQARIIGDIEYLGTSEFDYISKSSRSLGQKSAVYKFSGQLMLNVQGPKKLATLMKFTAIVQRAYVQDKRYGYQIVFLKME